MASIGYMIKDWLKASAKSIKRSVKRASRSAGFNREEKQNKERRQALIVELGEKVMTLNAMGVQIPDELVELVNQVVRIDEGLEDIRDQREAASVAEAEQIAAEQAARAEARAIADEKQAAAKAERAAKRAAAKEKAAAEKAAREAAKAAAAEKAAVEKAAREAALAAELAAKAKAAAAAMKADLAAEGIPADAPTIEIQQEPEEIPVVVVESESAVVSE